MNNRRNQLMLASAREYCKCVVEGKTIKYNQLVENGNFSSTSDWQAVRCNFSVSNNVATITPTDIHSSFIQEVANTTENHKYFYTFDVKYGNGEYFDFLILGNGRYNNYGNGEFKNYNGIITATNSNVINIYDYDNDSRSTYYIKNFMLIDLTELGLDNINSVADFYATDLGKYIRKGNYLETTSGAFIQAKTPINFKGVNIWSEKTTLVSNHLESENINCLPNKNYYFSYSREGFAIIGTIYWYDKNGTQLDYNDFYERNIVAPNNASYFKLVFNSTYGTTYNHDICISENAWDENWELVNSKLTSKSPIKVFEGATYFITAPLLWGIFESDASGNMGNGIETYSVSGGYRFKIPKNCHYIMFNMASLYGSAYNNDIAIFYVGYQKYCGRTGKVFVIDYNQQIKNGNFATTDDWDLSNATLSVSDNVGNISRITDTSAKISQTIKLVATHTYAIMFKAKTSISYTDSKLTLNGNNIDTFTVQGAGALWQDFGYILSNPSLNGDYALDLYLNLSGTFISSIYDFFYIKEFNVVDLTALGMDNISTISDFNNTDLGQLIAEKGYLPYSQRNVGYALGKQLQKGDYYKTYGVDKVSYNNFCYNGNFTLNEGWRAENGTITISNNKAIVTNNASGGVWCYGGLYGNNYMQKDHKYLLKATVKPSTNASIWFVYNGQFYTFIEHSVNANQLTEISEIGVFSETPVSSGYLVGVRCANGVSDINDTLEVSNVMVIDLTALGLDNITTIEEFYRTPLGMLVKKGFYLNYTTSNKTIKPQLIRTMKEIDMEDLNWQSDEIGMYAPLPSDCKKVENNEIPNLLATNYKTSSSIGAQYMDIFIGEEWGLGWCFVVRYLYDFPTGKLMYELNTPVIVDEEIEDIMVSRRTIGVESDNGIDLDFTKE